VIRYRLQCANAHEFEAWFASSASYDVQSAGAQICCPECNSCEVGKSIMAPNVAPRTRGDVAVSEEEAPARVEGVVAAIGHHGERGPGEGVGAELELVDDLELVGRGVDVHRHPAEFHPSRPVDFERLQVGVDAEMAAAGRP